MKQSASVARDRLDVALAVDRAVRTATQNLIPEGQFVSSSDIRSAEIFGGAPTDAGAVVTASSAMRVSAVYAAVRLVAGVPATLPWHVYRREADGSRERADHDLWWLLNEEACATFTSSAMWMNAIASVQLRGDGLVMIDRKSRYSNDVRALIPLKRDNVLPYRTADNRLAYRVYDDTISGKTDTYFTLLQDDVLHFTGDFFNGVTSMSVIASAARQSIGIALRADQHAARAFGDGAYLQHVLRAPKSMNTKAQDELRAAFAARYAGGAGVSPIPLVLTEGMEIDSISLSPADQQLLETRRWQISDIARAFGVPPHMIGDVERSTSWGTGIEQMYLGFIRGQLPLLRRITQELNRKLFARAGMFIEPDLEALTDGDAKTQADYFQKALGGPGAQGWMAVDEVRRKKNLKPQGGEFATVARAGTGLPEPEPTPPAEPDPAGDDPAAPAPGDPG